MTHPASISSPQLLVIDRAGSVLKRFTSLYPDVFAYSAFGDTRPAADVTLLLGFDNQYREALTGVYLLGNGYRSFNPVLMRFVSTDDLSPFGKGGINTYAYCQNDPVNRTDPSGRIALYGPALATLATIKFRGLLYRRVPRNGTNGDMFIRGTSMPPRELPTMQVTPSASVTSEPGSQPSIPPYFPALPTRRTNSSTSPQPVWPSAPTNGTFTEVPQRPLARVSPRQVQRAADEGPHRNTPMTESNYSRSRSSSIESTDSWDEWIPDQEALDAHRQELLARRNRGLRTSL